MDLIQLQAFVKRDPAAYRDEFLIQQRHFLSQLQIFQTKPQSDHKEFALMIQFMAHVAPCYPVDLQDFPTQVATLLEQNGKVLDPELRKTMVQSLIHLRSRNVLTPTSLLQLFFKLFAVPDKKLRDTLYHHIINDIKRLNEKKKDDRINRPLQNFMYTMLQSSSPIGVRMSIHVMIELFKKNIWNDSKTINVISQAAFFKDTKVVLAVLHFFLSPRGEEDEDEEDKDHRQNRRDIIKKYGHGAHKKTSKRKKKLRRALQELAKDRKDQLDKRVDDRRTYNYKAMMLIHDPQGYAEKIYRMLVKSNEKFETKIMLMNFLSRLISAHQLILLDFYSLMLKYMQPHQQHVTQLLAITAQSCHPMVSPDTIEPLIAGICNQFVSDRRTNDAIAIGLNTVREICLRCPLAMNATLLKDLIQYKGHNEKGVAMAAKSLVTLFRVINPMLLPKKWRGKEFDESAKPRAFGAVTTSDHLDGTELLDQADVFDDESGSGSDDDGWVSVSGDEMDHSDIISGSDSEDDEMDTSASGAALPSWIDDNDEEDGENDDEEGPAASGDDEGEGEDDADAIEAEDVDDEEELGELEELSEGDELDSDELDQIDWGDDGAQVRGDDAGSEDGDNSEHKSNGDEHSAVSSVVDRPEAILSDEDFAKMRRLKERRGSEEPKKSKKRSYDQMTATPEEGFADIEPGDLEGYRKRMKRDREARLATIKESRDEREAEKAEARGEKKGRKSNLGKKKTKNFQMIKHSLKVREKSKMSMASRKARQSAHVKNIKKMDKSLRSKILKK